MVSAQLACNPRSRRETLMESDAAKRQYSPGALAAAEMSLRDYLRIFSRRRWHLLGPLVLALLAALLYCWATPPKFRCKAEVLLPSGPAGPLGGSLATLVSSVAPGLSSSGSYQVGTEAAVLRSWPLQERALALLQAFPEFFRQCSEGQVVPQTLDDIPKKIQQYFLQHTPTAMADLSASRKGRLTKKGRSAAGFALATSSSSQGVEEEKLRQMLREMRVAPAQQGNVLQLTLVSHWPYEAADLLNSLCVAYLLNDLRNAQLSSELGLQYVADQLEKARQELAAAEQAVADFQARHRLGELEEYTKQLVDTVSSFRQTVATLEGEVRAQEAQDKNLEQQLRAQAKTVVSSQTFSNNPLVQQLQAKLADLEAERARLLTQYTETSQAVREVDTGIAAVREQLKKTMREIVSARIETPNPVRSDLLRQYILGQTATLMARARKAALEAAVSRLEAQLQALPPLAMQLARLQRQAQIAQEKYLALSRWYQQYQLAKASQTTPLQILSPACVDSYLLTHPDWPKPALLIALAVALGGLVGLALGLTAEYLDERYPDAPSMEADLGIPILAQIPQVKAAQVPVVSDEGCPEQVRDALLTLQLNVWLAHPSKGSLPVLLVGPKGGEGTSWVVYNTGLLSSEAGHKTVVVDCDLRHPSLHEYADGPLSPGVAEVLIGSAGLEQALQRPGGREEAMAVLPAGEGKKVGRPAAVWESKSFVQMMDRLSTDFDLILVDAPPVLQHPDALAISRACKGIILVTALARSKRAEIRQALHALRRSGLPVLGLVVNQV
jgi:capsular exopolysaccharide synthesis family protein